MQRLLQGAEETRAGRHGEKNKETEEILKEQPVSGISAPPEGSYLSSTCC